MDFSELLHGFVERGPHNEEMGERGTDVGFWAQQGQSCEMDLSKLIYGFL